MASTATDGRARSSAAMGGGKTVFTLGGGRITDGPDGCPNRGALPVDMRYERAPAVTL